MSEKARSAAYDLLVAMGRRMQQGGIVKRSLLVDGSMDVEGSGPIASDGKFTFRGILFSADLEPPL